MTPPFDQVFGLSLLGTGPVHHDRLQRPPLPHWERILISPQTRHYVPVPVAHDRVSRFPGLGSRARSLPATVPPSLLPPFSPGRKVHPTRSLGWRGMNFFHCLKESIVVFIFFLNESWWLDMCSIGTTYAYYHWSLVSRIWDAWVCVFLQKKREINKYYDVSIVPIIHRKI